MVFTLMLTSKGVAGVPRAMLVILLGTLDSFHLPAWPVVLILGIDQFMDMARTATNVLGNCLARASRALPYVILHSFRRGAGIWHSRAPGHRGSATVTDW